MIRYSHLDANETAFYERDGYVLLPGLISADVAERIASEVSAIMDVIGLGQSKLRQTTQHLRGSDLDHLIHHPDLKKLAGQLMGGESTVYMPFTAVKSANGGGKFHFHQDNQYTEFDGPGINFWFALSEMSPENGCLQVVPRSHFAGTFEAVATSDGDHHKTVAQEPETFVPLRMRPGDCVAFSRLTLHGSGPNTTDRNRIAYAIQFHRDDVNARWKGQDWIRLKDHPRWPTEPVDHITPPENVSLDGH